MSFRDFLMAQYKELGKLDAFYERYPDSFWELMENYEKNHSSERQVDAVVMGAESAISDWISTGDKLPAEKGEYLIYCNRVGRIEIAKYDKKWYVWETDMFGDRDWLDTGKVNYWMPLPNSPV